MFISNIKQGGPAFLTALINVLLNSFIAIIKHHGPVFTALTSGCYVHFTFVFVLFTRSTIHNFVHRIKWEDLRKLFSCYFPFYL